MLICIMLFTSGPSSDIAGSDALPGTGRMLSSLSEDECLEFLLNMGVNIPDEFRSKTNIGSMVKELITELESDPDRTYAISYTVAYNFIEDVRTAVKKYQEQFNEF